MLQCFMINTNRIVVDVKIQRNLEFGEVGRACLFLLIRLLIILQLILLIVAILKVESMPFVAKYNISITQQPTLLLVLHMMLKYIFQDRSCLQTGQSSTHTVARRCCIEWGLGSFLSVVLLICCHHEYSWFALIGEYVCSMFQKKQTFRMWKKHDPL